MQARITIFVHPEASSDLVDRVEMTTEVQGGGAGFLTNVRQFSRQILGVFEEVKRDQKGRDNDSKEAAEDYQI